MIRLDEQRYQDLLAKEQAHDDYMSATQYMTGYMQRTKELLDTALEAGDGIEAERMKGRIEAVVSFNRAVYDRAWLRGERT